MLKALSVSSDSVYTAGMWKETPLL